MAKKQTSDKSSSASGRLLSWRRFGGRFWMLNPKSGLGVEVTDDVMAAAGSAEGQDETKGKRRARK